MKKFNISFLELALTGCMVSDYSYAPKWQPEYNAEHKE